MNDMNKAIQWNGEDSMVDMLREWLDVPIVWKGDALEIHSPYLSTILNVRNRDWLLKGEDHKIWVIDDTLFKGLFVEKTLDLNSLTRIGFKVKDKKVVGSCYSCKYQKKSYSFGFEMTLCMHSDNPDIDIYGQCGSYEKEDKTRLLLENK